MSVGDVLRPPAGGAPFPRGLKVLEPAYDILRRTEVASNIADAAVHATVEIDNESAEQNP